MTIHLLRHGKTPANEQQLFCGSTDIPLSPKGIDEIKELIKPGFYPQAEMIYTSGLIRAKQTADLIYGHSIKREIPDLNEYDFGLFEMKHLDEIKDRADFIAWVNDESGSTKCPEGESQQDYIERVLRGFNTVLEETRSTGNDSVIIICHGGVIVRIMESLFSENKAFPQWQPDNGRGYTITYASAGLHSYQEI